MNLYLISQSAVDGWDTYDSAVVIAASEDDARCIYPGYESIQQVGDDAVRVCHIGDKARMDSERWQETLDKWMSDWTKNPKDVTVELLGPALGNTERVVCASFNAG